MVLDSQMPRSGFRRSYMSTGRRRRGARWPWVALVAGAAIVITVYSFLGDDGQPAIAQANGDSLPDAQTKDAPTAATPAAQAPAPAPVQSVQQLPSPRTIEPARPRPAATRTDAPVAAMPPAAGSSSPADKRQEMVQGMRLIEEGKLVEGRAALSKLLTAHPSLSRADEQQVRDVVASVNDDLIFSPKITPGDPLVERYVVQSGDLLARIAPRYKVTYQLLEQINATPARNLQAGKAIKLVKGPFFAVVSKSQFRMDVYLTGPDGLPVYIRSFPVGLGENDYTPTGTWVIKKGSKTVNPDWRNPNTGEYFAANDPKNPIGEYWLALEGLDGDALGKQGFGIHGTIDPDSIGRQMSLGCIRLNPPDIEQVFKLLVDGESKVYVVR